jgi:hypothetical protein
MRKSILFATIGVSIFVLGLAWAQKPTVSHHQPTPIILSNSQASPAYGFTLVSLLRAFPNTIPFMANNPGGTVSGGSLATVVWIMTQGRNGQTWTLRAGASSPTFSGCATVPESAVSVKCVSASVDGGGQVSAGCNLTSFTTLPNTLPGLPVASGNEGNSSLHNYTVVLSYQLADSWRYIANTCPLTVTYTVSAQ